MIVDLNICNKTIVIVGGGDEAAKRCRSLQGQGSNIIIVSETWSPILSEMHKLGQITIIQHKVSDPQYILDLNPDMILATTNNYNLNHTIIKSAKEHKILSYSSDDHTMSDFANPSKINIKDVIKFAIFTSGQSPMISKRLRMKIEPILRDVITDEDINQIKIHARVRDLAKSKLETPKERRQYLNDILNDPEIEQLIKAGYVDRAERKAIKMLENRSNGTRDY